MDTAIRELEILQPGPLGTIQDLGRPGYAQLGVSPSGAADRHALALANRLVGNADPAAGLELTLGGLIARFSADPATAAPALVAITGAGCSITIDDRPAGGMCAPFPVPAGATLSLGTPPKGLRTYLAVRGGIAVPAVLGSRSTDTLSGLGPPPLAAGRRLPIGTEHMALPSVDVAPAADYPDPLVLPISPGPRADRFGGADALDRLCAASYLVTPDSNRSGVRLHGPVIPQLITSELPSEGLIAGAIQIPAGGQPVVFLADHPVTGGYPVIAVVRAGEVGLAAQARPGQLLRFRRVG